MKRLILTILWGVLYALSASAQDKSGGVDMDNLWKDPVGKPAIWARLEDDPDNDELWHTYFGKDAFEFTHEEVDRIARLKTRIKEGQEKELEAAEQAKLKAYIERREGKNKVDPHYNFLISNISKNFVMIEEYFSEEFGKLGKEYKDYTSTHPDGKYPKHKWVEEQEIALGHLRASQ